MIEWAVIIGMGALVVMVAVLVPTLVTLRTLLVEASQVLEDLRHRLPDIISASRETMDNLNRLSDEARRGTEQLSVFFRAVEDLGQQLRSIQSLVRQKSSHLVGNARGGWAAVRAAASVLAGHITHAGGHNGH